MAKSSNRKYFLNFVEEGIMNPQYAGYVGGRIEVFLHERLGGKDSMNTQYAVDEIRFFTNKLKEFFEFRDENDLRVVNSNELSRVVEIVKSDFHEKIK